MAQEETEDERVFREAYRHWYDHYGEHDQRHHSFESECQDIMARHYRPIQSYGNDPGFVLLACFVGFGLIFSFVNAILVVHFGIDVTGLFQNVLDQR